MDNRRSSTTSNSRRGVASFLVGFALLAATQAQAQQRPPLTAPYAKAALLSLRAIESDTSIPQDKNDEGAGRNTTLQTIDTAREVAVTEEEVSITTLLRQIYQLRLQDNDLMNAYGKVMEIENADDPSDGLAARRKKDSAVSQFADVEAAIMKREGNCFRQLGQSLLDRSPDAGAACSEWIQKTKISGKRPIQSATTLAANPAKQ
jgi:hypothetical protein